MTDSTLQITPGAGDIYARVLQSLTVDGHTTVVPYHMSLDGGPGWVATQTYTTSTDMTTATAITAVPTSLVARPIPTIFGFIEVWKCRR